MRSSLKGSEAGRGREEVLWRERVWVRGMPLVRCGCWFWRTVVLMGLVVRRVEDFGIIVVLRAVDALVVSLVMVAVVGLLNWNWKGLNFQACASISDQ